MFTEADIISRYTRADAIADGFLVDISETAREAGFVVPVAMTRAAWEDFVAWDQAVDGKRKGTYQDEAGRLWDVVYMASRAAKSMARKGMSEAIFLMVRVPREGRGRTPREVRVKLHSGPGDHGEQVITISLEKED